MIPDGRVDRHSAGERDVDLHAHHFMRVFDLTRWSLSLVTGRRLGPHLVRRTDVLRLPLFLVIALLPAPASQQRQPIDAAHILAFLNRTIAWDERLDAQGELADQPTDILYVNDNRQLGKQVVALTFEAAKAEAQFLAATAPAPAAPQNVNAQRLQRMTQRA